MCGFLGLCVNLASLEIIIHCHKQCLFIIHGYIHVLMVRTIIMLWISYCLCFFFAHVVINKDMQPYNMMLLPTQVLHTLASEK